MEKFFPGQRWISEMEPELGLGIITEVGERRIQLRFPASDCVRQYAIQTAPLRRVRFKVGNIIEGTNRKRLEIDRVVEADGQIVYCGDGFELPESELCHSISFTTPESRLLSGMVDVNRVFDLRYETLRSQCRIRKSSVCGFLGGRIDLIPHQIYIAHEVASRPVHRVLLADEVGLGKTIEACLILHRLLIRGRIGRVLILVPESLVHQWFVELLRRFNLVFRIFDESYCQSIETVNPGINPFLEDQLAICDIGFVVNNELRRQQVEAGEWDMLVVDEAHHLTEESQAYRLVENLGKDIPGMMLLTATPEQLGRRSHFARLRLLDPARYYEFESFLEEADNYREVAHAATKLLDGAQLNSMETERLSMFFSDENVFNEERLQHAVRDNQVAHQRLIEGMLDRYGPGRVIFRNTRASITGFPGRIVRLVRLQGCHENRECLTEEFMSDTGDAEANLSHDFKKDPRIAWLAELVREKKHRKILLICRSMAKARAIDEALRDRIKVKAALFHEKLSLIQRDRNAAWFAEKNGARILICSEIGSEGRNFQFAHHLILFDLPLDPELLEQRIGRLDRIGQTRTITIYIPYVPGTPMEILVRWYHEGLNGFEMNVPGVYQIYEVMGQRIYKLAAAYPNSRDTVLPQVESLLEETRIARDDIADNLKQGRDRLLELNSFRPHRAEGIVREIEASDKDEALDEFMSKVFYHFGVKTEESGNRTFRLNFDLLSDHAFPIPLLREEGMTVTYDREKALSREDIGFLTWDHPMVSGAMDLMLGSEQGNSGYARWPDSESQEILLETVYIIECVAPVTLQVDRFLPPTPIRIVVNDRLQDCSTAHSFELFSKCLKDCPDPPFFEDSKSTRELFHEMLERSRQVAETRLPDIINGATARIQAILGKEVRRLQDLKAVNPNVREEEISLAKREMASLRTFIASSRLRLDALRLIWKGKSQPGKQ